MAPSSPSPSKKKAAARAPTRKAEEAEDPPAKRVLTHPDLARVVLLDFLCPDRQACFLTLPLVCSWLLRGAVEEAAWRGLFERHWCKT